MSNILKSQQVVQTEFAQVPCVVESLLGSGGQGEVYRARLGNNALALKWYYPPSATPEQRAALETLIKKGPPSEMFLWPLDLARAPGVPGYGYLMPLREGRFRSGNELARRLIEPTFRVLITAGLNLAQAFLQLHARGLAYRDISFGNIFLDPKTGAVLICDTDNIGIDGQAHSGVLGTPRFMAPEIVLGKVSPSTQTDQFSLAVLLFYMLMMHHPLEGKREAAIRCLDLPAMVKLYGSEPVFVADPNDASNRAVAGVHDNILAFWPIYPMFLKQLFTRAFTRGLRDPASRVRESEWRQALVQLRDCIVYCPACQAENFFNPPAAGQDAKELKCWSCQRPVPLPPALSLGKHIVMLNHDTRLYLHHLDDQASYDFSRPLAEVSRHPTNPDLWGLKNLSAIPWTATTAAAQVNSVPPGRSVSLAPGTRIQFAAKSGEVLFLLPVAAE
jgi:DNA-binding helix-hairpin-helix protein with protein kinase domain